MKARSSDILRLWPSPISIDDHNLSLRDTNGNTVFTIYGLTSDQLAAFSLVIAEALGRAPDLTRVHLRQAYELLGQLLKEAHPEEPPMNMEHGDASCRPV